MRQTPADLSKPQIHYPADGFIPSLSAPRKTAKQTKNLPMISPATKKMRCRSSENCAMEASQPAHCMTSFTSLSRSRLFYRNGFCEIARLIDIAAAQHRGVIGEKLKGRCRRQRHQLLPQRGKTNHRIRQSPWSPENPRRRAAAHKRRARVPL